MLKELRTKRCLTLKELAKKLNISKKLLMQLEDEPQLCNPSVNLILKLSEALGIDDKKLFLYFVEIRKNINNIETL